MLLAGNRCWVPLTLCGHAPRATDSPRYWKSETKNVQSIFDELLTYVFLDLCWA